MFFSLLLTVQFWAYQRCLELITYDVPQNQPGIVLPIGDALDRALPGAPTAFLHPDRFAVIDNTQEVTFAQGVPEPARNEVRQYFPQIHSAALEAFR